MRAQPLQDFADGVKYSSSSQPHVPFPYQAARGSRTQLHDFEEARKSNPRGTSVSWGGGAAAGSPSRGKSLTGSLLHDGLVASDDDSASMTETDAMSQLSASQSSHYSGGGRRRSGEMYDEHEHQQGDLRDDYYSDERTSYDGNGRGGGWQEEAEVGGQGGRERGCTRVRSH